MSQAKFDKAVAIVQSLPKDGPIKPSQEDQLTVRYFTYISIYLILTRSHHHGSFHLFILRTYNRD